MVMNAMTLDAENIISPIDLDFPLNSSSLIVAFLTKDFLRLSASSSSKILLLRVSCCSSLAAIFELYRGSMLLLLSDGLSSDKEIARPLRSDEIVPIALLLLRPFSVLS